MAKLMREQKAQIEQQLKARYTRLLEEVRDELEASGEQHYIDLAGRVPDSGDESVANMLTDFDAAIVDRQIHELRDIEAARQRLKEGCFGSCIECGDDIAFERLLAYPTAKRCYPCQDQHEKTFAGEGTPTL